MRRPWPLLFSMLAACAGAPVSDPEPFPPARPELSPRLPSPREVAWERCGEELRALEASALLTYRFGCSRCTRFQSSAVFLQPDGNFRVLDLVNRAELMRGRAAPDRFDVVVQALASDAWRDLDEGAELTQTPPRWVVLQAGPKKVQRTYLARESLPAPVVDLQMALHGILVAPLADDGAITACRR